jgi:hypothetical protein
MIQAMIASCKCNIESITAAGVSALKKRPSKPQRAGIAA